MNKLSDEIFRSTRAISPNNRVVIGGAKVEFPSKAVLEKEFEREIRDYLETEGCYLIPHIEVLNYPGFPDIMGSFKGRPFGIELKMKPVKNFKENRVALQASRLYMKDKAGWLTGFAWPANIMEVLFYIFSYGRLIPSDFWIPRYEGSLSLENIQ